MNPSAPQPPPAQIQSVSVGNTDVLSFTEQRSHHIYIQAQFRPWYVHVSSAQHTVAHTYANMYRIHISTFQIFHIRIQPNIKTGSSKSPAGENIQEDILCARTEKQQQNIYTSSLKVYKITLGLRSKRIRSGSFGGF